MEKELDFFDQLDKADRERDLREKDLKERGCSCSSKSENVSDFDPEEELRKEIMEGKEDPSEEYYGRFHC